MLELYERRGDSEEGLGKDRTSRPVAKVRSEGRSNRLKCDITLQITKLLNATHICIRIELKLS